MSFTGAGACMRGVGALQELGRWRAGARLSLDRDMEATALETLLDEQGLGRAFELAPRLTDGEAGW